MINQQERGLDLSSIYRIDMDKRSKNKEKYNITEYNLPEYVILDDDNDSDKDDQDPSTDSKQMNDVDCSQNDNSEIFSAYQEGDMEAIKLPNQNIYKRMKEAFKYCIKQKTMSPTKCSNRINYSNGFSYYCNELNNNYTNFPMHNVNHYESQYYQNPHLMDIQKDWPKQRIKLSTHSSFDNPNSMINEEEDYEVGINAFQRIQLSPYSMEKNRGTCLNVSNEQPTNGYKKIAPLKYGIKKNKRQFKHAKINKQKLHQYKFEKGDRKEGKCNKNISTKEETRENCIMSKIKQQTCTEDKSCRTKIQKFCYSEAARYRYRFCKVNQQIMQLSQVCRKYAKVYKDQRAIVPGQPIFAQHYQLSQFQNLKKNELIKRQFIEIQQ